jgi:hypothetical protein
MANKHILPGVNLSQDRTIKDHNSLIIQAIEELIDYTISFENNNEFSALDFKNNLTILQRCYEMLERKLLT